MTLDGKPALGIGMVGYSFMGVAHSHAWRDASSFFDVALVPRLRVLAGRNEQAARDVASRFGWESVVPDWQSLVHRTDVDLVDVCTPGDTHAEIAIAALEAGKHVLCEKPLANTVAEAEAMTRAADRAAESGVRSMVGFTYRRVPAIALARRLVADGTVGEIRHVRAQYLQDWASDPDVPLNWRLQKERAGSGALGDIGAHIVDLTQFITGERITGVSAMLDTFVTERPVAEGDSVSTPNSLSGAADAPSDKLSPASAATSASAGRGQVTVDDAATFLARFTGGAMATFEATRFASGRKNSIRIEINGSAGSLAFDFEDMNVLHVHDHTEDPARGGFRRVLVTESDHPYLAAWWPPGHLLGYEHSFTHQAVDLVTAIADGADPWPSFADGLAVQRVLAAVEASAAGKSVWTEVPT
ncbi:putative dehydrogenase [Haloactinopolyspora alba]|uniref:Putative dehydrogenase n=1 Tax=Haloactinopolyspora alba TaxID=648780 RepID=A0A2P8EC03_9ACTN|nr:Gfo/Idh/MocA family oxidoreductase [Haloactinopolyspora alba]PSL06992.1 putative dehydrogenase [Haloactinopolyspora alba]